MVTDHQVKRLKRLVNMEKTLSLSAAKAGMCEKTARKYLRAQGLPSELERARRWRTRADPFVAVWEEVRAQLEDNPGLEAKTLFEDLQRRNPGRFQDGQLRTFQRRVKAWRALEGPEGEVFFEQAYEPGALCQSDFTHVTSLGVSIAGQPFAHLVYHFVLPFSNWETGTLCFSESFESLAQGLQNALWQLGGVPRAHQSDRFSSAVTTLDDRAEFTERYRGLLRHYGLEGRMIQAGKAHENGDVEQRHRRFKRALDQALMLRGSRDFASREAYEAFLGTLFAQLNAGRQVRLADELTVLGELPRARMESFEKVRARVSKGSTITVGRNVYSVPSRLIGEQVHVRVYAEHLEVWYAQQKVEVLGRLRGRGQHRINYRHVITWLVRKPGAFAHYRYRSNLFPTSRFRMAYDLLEEAMPSRAAKEYLKILHLAAVESETAVDDVLRVLVDTDQAVSFEVVEAMVARRMALPRPTEIAVDPVALEVYDDLLEHDGPAEERRAEV